MKKEKKINQPQEITDGEARKVTGGIAYSAGNYSYTIWRHKNCGGEILNVGDPFHSCVCSKCGETHYWHYSFDTYKEYEK